MTAVHKAYVKTGHHNDVNALAGYVFGASGHHYAVAFLINDPHAEQAQEALDLLLEWVWQNG
jgi:D-alanyl-D-alanine carboxypeptidase